MLGLIILGIALAAAGAPSCCWRCSPRWNTASPPNAPPPPVPSPKPRTGASAVPWPAPGSCVSTSQAALPSRPGIAYLGNWLGPGHRHADRARQAFMFHLGAGQRDGVVAKFPAWRSRAMLAGLALACKQARRMAMAATTPFTIGADATCTDGVCDTVSRSAGGRDAVDVAGSRPRLGREFRWPFTAAR